jgi:cation diffusion facilitator family transporter
MALAGLGVNTVLAFTKILAGVIGHSYALIADGVESTLDIFGSLVVVGGLRVAATPPDHNHPYGHGKAEPLAAAVISLALIGAAAGLAVMSVREILTPHHAPAPYTLLVLIGVIALKETLFRAAIKVGDHIDSTAVRADAWHHRSDAITSVAAFIGIGIALIGGPGYESADDWAALLACGVIAFNGFRLIGPALADLMDTAPSPELEQRVRAAAATVPGVIDLDKYRARKMGLDYYVELHIRVDGSIPVLEGHRIAHRVKDAVRTATPQIADVLVHVEPQADANGRSIGV